MLDAILVTCHSEKEQAAPTFKGGFGYHPLTAWLDNTGEALAAVLRPGNAGSNTAADHITVTDLDLDHGVWSLPVVGQGCAGGDCSSSEAPGSAADTPDAAYQR